MGVIFRFSIARLHRAVLAATLVLVATGCTHVGPHAMRQERIHYNNAIQKTNNQEMLLNLVRLRYLDVPYMMNVSSVSSQRLLAVGANVSNLPEGWVKPFPFSLLSNAEDRPTISYSPLQGDEFVKNVLAQISLDDMILLYHSGWNVDTIFRICVQQMNGLRNAFSVSETSIPEFQDFQHATWLLSQLQARHGMELGYESRDEQTFRVLKLSKEAQDWPETKELIGLLGLTPGKDSYVVDINAMHHDPDALRMKTRSLGGVFRYLAQAVDVPEKDIEENRVVVNRTPSGAIFNWEGVLGDLLQISSSGTEPSNAYASVYYRGRWFYVDDSDMASKATFMLLTQLFSLRAGKIQIQKPTLTLSVGQ